MTVSATGNNPLNNPFAVLNGSSGTATGSASGNTVDPNSAQGIQNRFLALLTTQLKAQDPGNPMDNNQITSQMAQISQVTGMQTLNQTMQSLLRAQMSSQSLLAATTVGRQAMVAGNNLVSDGSHSMAAGVSLAGNAQQLVITVQNASGQTVDAFQINNPQPGMNAFGWDGTDGNGKPLPAGQYTFSATASNVSAGGSVQVGSSTFVNKTISAVSWDSTGAPQLILSDGSKVGMSQVQQIS